MRPDPHTTPYQTPIIVGGDRVVSQRRTARSGGEKTNTGGSLMTGSVLLPYAQGVMDGFVVIGVVVSEVIGSGFADPVI